MTNAPHSVLLIGGRDAGKSNFLFRLWIAVDHGRGYLKKDGLPNQLAHLQEGAETLLGGEFAKRTNPEGLLDTVEIPVLCGPSEVKGLFVVPDAPGEQFISVYKNRAWDAFWEARITKDCGSLIFIRAGSDQIVAPLDWATCHAKMGVKIDAHTGDEHVEPPTQVLLTDWLQILREAFDDIVGSAFRPRVGIVVSGWDSVPPEQQGNPPFRWIAENFPLLGQFIETNYEHFEFQIFGVSVVSGDLKNDSQFREEYLQGSPAEFGYVVHSITGPLSKSTDITIPVAWALGHFSNQDRT